MDEVLGICVHSRLHPLVSLVWQTLQGTFRSGITKTK